MPSRALEPGPHLPSRMETIQTTDLSSSQSQECTLPVRRGHVHHTAELRESPAWGGRPAAQIDPAKPAGASTAPAVAVPATETQASETYTGESGRRLPGAGISNRSQNRSFPAGPSSAEGRGLRAGADGMDRGAGTGAAARADGDRGEKTQGRLPGPSPGPGRQRPTARNPAAAQ